MTIGDSAKHRKSREMTPARMERATHHILRGISKWRRAEITSAALVVRYYQWWDRNYARISLAENCLQSNGPESLEQVYHEKQLAREFANCVWAAVRELRMAERVAAGANLNLKLRSIVLTQHSEGNSQVLQDLTCSDAVRARQAALELVWNERKGRSLLSSLPVLDL